MESQRQIIRSRSRARKDSTVRTPAIEQCLRPVLESLEVRRLMSVPNGPFAMSAAATSPTQASLTWYDSANDATGYRVMREGTDGSWQAIAYLDANATQYTDSALASGSQYTYSVCAFNDGGDSSTTTSNPITTPGIGGVVATPVNPILATTVPDGPYVLSAAASSGTQVSLSWYDADRGLATGYRVMRLGADGSWQAVGTTSATATTFTDTTASSGSQYTYSICAYNSIGDSSFTNQEPVTTPGSTSPGASTTPVVTTPVTIVATPVTWTIPDGPFAPTITAASATQVNLSWYDAHSNEIAYNVERETGSGAYTVVATLGANATSYTDSSVTASTQYSYRIYATNAAGASSAAAGTVTTPAAGGVLASSGSSSPATASAAGYFPVGVFYQPTYSFSKWTSRGVNLVYGYEQGNGDTMAQWDSAAAAAGLKEIRQPAATPSADASVSNLTAWLAPQDEPESNGTSAATLAGQYATLKAAAPNIPVITTYSGGTVIGWQGSTSAAQYKQYLSATDWVGADIYPVTGWNLPSKLNAVGQVVDTLSTLAPGKSDYAFIETSNQQLSWVPNDRGVMPDEVRAEIWDAVIHGASGIVYFPQQIGSGFQYDTTPANVVTEITADDAKLQQYGAALTSSATPSGVSATGGGSLQVTTRVYGGHKYFFVLNLSANTVSGQAININGLSPNTTLSVDGENRTVQVNGTAVTDTFSPYALHIYVA